MQEYNGAILKKGEIDMKKFLALVLVVALVFSMSACGKSEEAKACEQLINSIEAEINLDNCGAVAAARFAYDALSDEDAEKVDTSSLESAETTLLNLTGSPFAACKEVKDTMKDPTSFRIYGDVLFVVFNAPDKSTSTTYVTCLTGDAKNSYGAYAGKTKFEVMHLGGESFWFSEDSSSFLGLSDTINAKNLTDEQWADQGFTWYVFSGERIAELINCEYVS